ncbi:MAG: molybdopterin-dependent oxidoreductase, partial [Nitrospinaceae bacterium]|nr:molybdopterin-dependent oxidoreductase [Nitrospinaceae bacterium]
MSAKLSRRKFLKIAAGGTGVVAVAATGSPARAFSLSGKKPTPRLESDKIVPSTCAMCYWQCGIHAHVKNGRVNRIEGNPDDPLSRGKLCPRGVAGIGQLYDPDRLRTPLIRERSGGKQFWREASWDEALDFAAERLDAVRKKYGPEAIALFTHGPGSSHFRRLLKAIGSPNVAASSFGQCRGPRDVGFELTFGMSPGSPENIDVANAECLVLLGSHLGENMHNTAVQEFSEFLGNGGNLIVVDPRFSVAASKAKHWLPIRPGTDMALLLAWINVILNEKLYDKDYVNNYCSGLKDLWRAVWQYTPDWAYAETGIEASVIHQTARELAKALPRTIVHPGRHVTWYGDDTQRSRAIAILNALLGSWGRKGGFYMRGRWPVPPYPIPKFPKPQRPRADGVGQDVPFGHEGLVNRMRDATRTGKPYPIKAWMVYATNLIHNTPGVKETREAIDKLDFMMAVDIMPSDITGYADLILPESTYLERYDDLRAGATDVDFIQLRQPVIPPLKGTRPGWQIAKDIAMRLSLKKYFPWKDFPEYLDKRLQLANLSLRDAREKGVFTRERSPRFFEDGAPVRFRTESGKIELFSLALLQKGFEPVPRFTRHPQPPVDHYRLIYGRSANHTFAWTQNNRLLLDHYPENTVWMNTNEARAKGLGDGEYVRLYNEDGVTSFPVKLKVTEGIRPDCVYIVHGFGQT